MACWQSFNAGHVALCDRIVSFMRWDAETLYQLVLATQPLLPSFATIMHWLQQQLSPQQEWHVLHVCLLRLVGEQQLDVFPAICQRLQLIALAKVPFTTAAELPVGVGSAAVITALVASPCSNPEDDQRVLGCLQALHACNLLTVCNVLSAPQSVLARSRTVAPLLLMINHGYISSTTFVLDATLLPLKDLSLVLLMQPQAGLQAIVAAAICSELPSMFDLVADKLTTPVSDLLDTISRSVP